MGSNYLISCAITKRLVGKADADVDHVIPFVFLVESFVDQFSVDVSSIEFVENDYGVSVDFADQQLKSKWQEFHRNRAELQIAHRNANQSKGCKILDEHP